MQPLPLPQFEGSEELQMKIVKSLKGDKKIVITMPAYNASKTLEATINEIPDYCYDSIIVVDDASSDNTVEIAQHLKAITKVIVHDHNQGYGGNQKSLYNAALEEGADIVVLLHPDNQYNPAIVPNIVLPLLLDQSDVVFASRFIQNPLEGGAWTGGMPLVKYFVNRALTTLQNWMMGTYFTEFHTGYRAYNRHALESVNYEKMSNDFVFDNQIIAPMIFLKLRFHQIGVETRYFHEASSINYVRGAIYAWGCLQVGFQYLLHRIGLRKWHFLEDCIKTEKGARSETSRV
jgi:glycosyltransferase involved in cell wall biosynthesis